MRISDWSSDVCSSDLNRTAVCRLAESGDPLCRSHQRDQGSGRAASRSACQRLSWRGAPHRARRWRSTGRRAWDGENVAEGKRGAVRVDTGCRRISKHNPNVATATGKKIRKKNNELTQKK